MYAWPAAAATATATNTKLYGLNRICSSQNKISLRPDTHTGEQRSYTVAHVVLAFLF